MTYPVKYYDSEKLTLEPVLSGTAGSRIALLDAVLVNGFNPLTASSVSVTAGVATATFAAPHGYIAGQIILMAGATPAGLNGEHYVTSVTSDTIVFSDFTGVADGTATGTITTKTAPTGFWEKTFSGTNKAAYRSTDLASTRIFMRVDDSNALYAIVDMYESMTDVDTGTGKSLQTVYWKGSDVATTSARPWQIASDSRKIWFSARWHGTYPTAGSLYEFGDDISLKEGDAFNCVLSGHTISSGTSLGTNISTMQVNGAEGTPSHIARSYTQLGGSIPIHKCGNVMSPNLGSGGANYPSAANNGLLLVAPIMTREGNWVSSEPRGYKSGLLQTVQNVTLPAGHIVEAIPQLPGRRVAIFGCSLSGSQVYAAAAIDITGPWR